MAVVLGGQRIRLALSHGAGRLLSNLFKRLKYANLPLLIPFVFSLIVFLRAMSGAGFEDPNSSTSMSLQSHDALHNSSSSFWNTKYAIGQSRWARLRSGFADTIWNCPASNEDMSESAANGSVYTPGCLKAKLQNVMRARVIAKDSDDFDMPSLKSTHDAVGTSEADDLESGRSSTSSDEEGASPKEEDQKQAADDERPRANWLPNHGNTFGSRNGFEVRRKPH